MLSHWMRLGMKLTMDTSMLALESQQVVALRMLKLSLGGPAAEREARRMVSEKTSAAGKAALTVASGGSADKVVRDYRRKVRANRSRLAGGG